MPATIAETWADKIVEKVVDRETQLETLLMFGRIFGLTGTDIRDAVWRGHGKTISFTAERNLVPKSQPQAD